MSLEAERRLHVCITGSSSGLGLIAAKRLVQDGHVVYHACRSQKRAEEAVEAAGGGIPIECDLADFSSVNKCARELRKIERLDVLCLNAAVAPSPSAISPKLTKDGLEECIGVNHFGHFLLANLLFKKLQARGGGRLVVTASSVHDPESPGGQSGGKAATLGTLSGLGMNLSIHPDGPTMVDGVVEYHGGKVYKDSKLCNLLFVNEAQKRFTGVAVRAFNPGFIPTTGLFQSMRDSSPWKARILTLFARAAGYSVPVEVGGERLVYMAISSDIQSGSYLCSEVGNRGITHQDGFVPKNVSKEAADSNLAKLLWDRSADVVKDWMCK